MRAVTDQNRKETLEFLCNVGLLSFPFIVNCITFQFGDPQSEQLKEEEYTCI